MHTIRLNLNDLHNLHWYFKGHKKIVFPKFLWYSASVF
jgi:hypothetical protein